MSLVQIVILAVVQGLAELLPVSSSAHVVVAEKILGLDPSSPPMTLLLVMLHTGTMIAVIVYFWQRWKETYLKSAARLKQFAQQIVIATAFTAVIGEVLIKVIEKTMFGNAPQAEIEDLFSHHWRRARALPSFSRIRSGATISAGMLAGVSKARAENFSFALAVVLTPPVVGREILRLVHFHGPANGLSSAILSGLLGAVLAFMAGLLALRWLSRWLEEGRWYLFGVYCLIAAGIVAALHYKGY